MAKDWKDPLEVGPPKNKLVEIMGIPNAERRQSKIQFKEWRMAAFLGDDDVWYFPEITMGNWTPVARVFYNEPYRWRDLRK
jgi:hypothetical protein